MPLVARVRTIGLDQVGYTHMAFLANKLACEVAAEHAATESPMVRRKPASAVARCTLDYVAFHARRRPDAAALLLDGRPTSYGDLFRDLQAAVRWLAALKMPPGRLVAVGFDDFATQLILMLALETVGLVAAGFRTSEASSCAALLARADLTLAQERIVGPYREPMALPLNWLDLARGVRSMPDRRWPTLADDAPFMVVRSSGTTGRSKLMSVTRGMQHARLRDRVRALGIGRHTRYLSTMQLGVGLNYTTVVSTLRVGGLVMSESVASVADAILMREPNLVNLLPYHLAQALNETAAHPSDDAGPRSGLRLALTGGKLDATLRRAALDQLCGELLEAYGANECGLMAMVDQDGVARAVRGVRLEVVDPSGAPVSLGAVGEIRASGPSIVTSYLDDARTSATVFRNGWYYPGDLALRLAPDLMRVLGRADDVVNVGGVKLSAVDVERLVTDCAASLGIAMRDVAVLATTDASAQPLIVICATGMRDADANALSDGLRPSMQVRFSIACMDAIPRTTGGKARRGDLKRIVDAAFGPRPSPSAVSRELV